MFAATIFIKITVTVLKCYQVWQVRQRSSLFKRATMNWYFGHYVNIAATNSPTNFHALMWPLLSHSKNKVVLHFSLWMWCGITTLSNINMSFNRQTEIKAIFVLLLFLKNFFYSLIFKKLAPWPIFHRVAMSVCLFVCLSVPSQCNFFRGLSSALRSHDQIPVASVPWKCYD